MITDQKVWQIGSGDNSRDYSQICLDFGIAMVGPGRPGNAKDHPENYEGENDWGVKLLQVKAGDIVLLRRGQTIVKAVGKVVKEYQYSLKLNDIHGWDLNHFLEIEWFVREDGEDIVLPHAMIGYSTLSAVGKNYDQIKKLVNGHKLAPKPATKRLDRLKLPAEVQIEDLTKHLIGYGLRIGDANNIADTIDKIIALVRWYSENDFNVLEHELRTFLVVPFLFSLGWSEQKIKIEFSKIDIAIFDKPYIAGEEQEPRIIVETKTFSDGLDFAREQSEYYAANYPACRIIVTTNGFRYNIYKKKGHSFVRYSYFNLLELREFDYIDNSIKGVLDGVISLSNF